VEAMDTLEAPDWMDCDEIEDTQMDVDELPDLLDPLLQAGNLDPDDEDDANDDTDDDEDDGRDDDDDAGRDAEDDNRGVTDDVDNFGEEPTLDTSDGGVDGDSIVSAEDEAGDDAAD
jgi:hypothetical protein